MAPAAVASTLPHPLPHLDEPDLGPQYLVQRHFEEARATIAKLQSLKESGAQLSQPPPRNSGPQGKVEPFTVVNDPSAWYATDVKNSTNWIYHLTNTDIKEIDAALKLVAGLGVRREGNLYHIQEKIASKEQFPLPTLGPKLEALRQEVAHGRGFQLIRGLPVDKYLREELLTIYWAFGLYWGKVVSQNGKGHIVGHVKDIGHDVKTPSTRVYATPLAQPWHCDSADIVALLCLKQAKEGGLSSWSSSVAIHNELLKLGRKDLVEALAGPDWWIDRKGEVPDGKLEAFPLRIFHYFKGYLSVFHTGTYYDLAQRHDFVPRLTDTQKEALRLFSALAESDELRMDYKLQPGDIQLLNNHTQQHQRSSFVDYDEVDRRRHLLRLWVSPVENRPLPEEYADLWNNTTPGERGGIFVKGNLTVPLEAE